MANTILTPTAVTREALRVLHQKLNFVGNINREYDDSFAKAGAKIGTDLKIRLPNQYTVRTGATLSTQATSEISTTLQVTTQKGVDLNFTSVDLTLSLDDFSKRILNPAMSVLAANIESDVMSNATAGVFADVYNIVNNVGSALTMNKLLTGRKVQNDNLSPMDSRIALLNTQDNVDLIDALKGLFQDSSAIAQQYKEGRMGRTAGYDFYENTIVPTQTTGTAAAATTYTVNGAAQTGATVTVAVGATTFKRGDVVTFVGCNRCHPETKADTGNLQTFVITADYAGGAGNLAISPSITVTGGRQNVTASPTNGGAVVKIGAASSVYKPSMLFHPDAFTFATADLVMPQGIDFASRQVMDGISMRIVRQYDISNDKYPTRLDVLYGFKTIRPELACRLLSN
jgi:hypothetical protein